jgi:hypothetical protein
MGKHSEPRYRLLGGARNLVPSKRGGFRARVVAGMVVGSSAAGW